MSITKPRLRKGLTQIRELVDGTHWIKGTYLTVSYEEGDGEYEDGAIVQDSKVVGCLVGLSRLVAYKSPTYYKGKVPVPEEVSTMRGQNEYAAALEQALTNTIRDEFVSDENMDEDYDPSDVSIEGWNDQNVRTKEEVLAMLDRAIERVG